QEDYVADEHGGRGDQPAAEIEQAVDRRGDRRAAAKIVAEIDQPVADDDALGEPVMEMDQAVDLAVDRGDRPHPDATPQDGELIAIFGHSRAPASTAAPRRRPQAALRTCSSRWVAAFSSIASTAASSRTRRSSAAW